MTQKNYFLFVDIGNTACDFLATDFQALKKRYKIAVTDFPLISKTMVALFKKYQNTMVYISSVNKPLQQNLFKLLNSRHVDYHLLDSSVMSAFCKKNHYTIPNISILGADLFCDIIAKESPKGRIVVDLGTATKILYLTQDQVFQGGQILPGLYAFPEILYQNTSLLGKNPLMERPHLVSLDTREAISSGAINGQAALISKTVEVLREKAGLLSLPVTFTGGNTPLIWEALKTFGLPDAGYDRNLVLEGLARAYGFAGYASLADTHLS
jgi:type III pantothenate kinase